MQNVLNGSKTLKRFANETQRYLGNWTDTFFKNMNQTSKQNLENFYLKTLANLTLEEYPKQATDIFMRKYYGRVKEAKKLM